MLASVVTLCDRALIRLSIFVSINKSGTAKGE